MSDFPYLGSTIAANGRIDDEIDRRITNALTFFALRQAVFKDATLPPKGWYIKPVCCQCCSMEESVGFL